MLGAETLFTLEAVRNGWRTLELASSGLEQGKTEVGLNHSVVIAVIQAT